ncbi:MULTISPECIES: LysR family transcriptional regulator [Rhizobium]|uniref:HTH-type transcriptional regulator TtuA n=1 Tax=Rhizobium esperanzae TaxID=1967781 RepID=A0A7W6UKT8_9HYPH|nr:MULTISPECIES: LysR family transcriptional regulator [Rhizobium]MBB4439950.1 DNA-binding transcriptional LysR family regulator [Rhizobium esperanzae]MDH6202483.1 DNA-binding transcriptional LysR family regulator [Rhizobium leguminosarum]
MHIDELRTFVEVADAGGVSAAAFRLGLSKSVISRRLARLEAGLGVQLLSRSTRGIFLTEAGESFREYAVRASAEMEMALDAIRLENELRGRLRVAVPLCDGELHFTPVLADMAHHHPDLRIDVTYSDRVVDLVAEGFDCAIRVGVLRDSSLLARRVGVINYKLVASPDYVALHGSPETPDELSFHKTLTGTQAWNLNEHGKIITFQPDGHFKADSSNALASAAVAGLGIAYLPDFVTHQYLASGALIPIMDSYPIPAAGIFLLRPSSPYTTAKVRVFSDLLARSLVTNRSHQVAGKPGPQKPHRSASGELELTH